MERCEKCGRIHELLDEEITKEDIDTIRLILNHLSCASQALDPRNIPLDASHNQITLFVQAALGAKAAYMSLEKEWWDKAKKDYGLPEGNIEIDWTVNKFVVTKD